MIGCDLSDLSTKRESSMCKAVNNRQKRVERKIDVKAGV